MSEFWARDIVNARMKFKEGNIEEGILILEHLLKSHNSECIRESKKLLAKTLIQFEDKRKIGRKYLEELYSEKNDIKMAVELMALSADLGDAQTLKKYYAESIALIENGANFNLILLNYLYFSALVHLKSDFLETTELLVKLIDEFKKTGVLDNHYLVTRSLPTFYDFLKTTEKLFLDNGKKIEFVEFLKAQLNWVDGTGNDIINEILSTY